MLAPVYGQQDTLFSKLKEVEVTESKNTYLNESSLNSVETSKTEMEQKGAFNISDGLAKLPGINQMSTGVAISKPVIRGLYGNRVQTVLAGLRFDNQQWQDEHGLGLSDIGIDRVEVIKGPAALLYGSEAIGGVLNVIEELPAPEGKTIGDINTLYFSNTTGYSVNAGIKHNKNNKNFRFRVGYESDADYTDGDNKRIANSRFDGLYGKASYGFRHKNWSSNTNYNFSKNDFGFIMADNIFSLPDDHRQSRVMSGPHHTVYLHILSSENVVRLKNSVLKLNLGGQYNNRLEDEGGGEISLDMLLTSALYNLQWIKILGDHTELIIGNQSILQNNKNYGKRRIVPNANISETGLSVFINHKIHRLVIEGGIGGNYRSIHALETKNFNDAGKEIHPFNSDLPSLNGLLGFTLDPNEHWTLKLCSGTGFRSPNLAELSSYGLHEGTYNFEIGDPTMKPEQNLNTEFTTAFAAKQLKFQVNAFYNAFNNYIYLSPTNENHVGIPIFRYLQGNATLYGGEAEITIKPAGIQGSSLQIGYAKVVGVLADGSNLPFIPADKITAQIRYTFHVREKFQQCYVYVGSDYVFPQSMPAPYETYTVDYCLLNAGLGTEIHLKSQPITISVTGNNLLNQAYYDHLSRFKAYGMQNIGRNISVNLHIPFGF